MIRVTLRSMHRPTERGHADGSGFGVTGGGLLPSDAGAIGGRLARKTAAITTIETAIAMRIVVWRRESIRAPDEPMVSSTLGPRFTSVTASPAKGRSCKVSAEGLCAGDGLTALRWI